MEWRENDEVSSIKLKFKSKTLYSLLDNNKSKKKKRKVNKSKFIKAFHDEQMTQEAGGDRHGP